MPYKNPEDRNYKRDWQKEKARQEKNPKVLGAKLSRQSARRKLDKDGVDRTGKDVAHVKSLAKGGSNKGAVFLESPSANRSYARASDHKPKSAIDKHSKNKKTYKV